jgi:Uma2 family endonuclease
MAVTQLTSVAAAGGPGAPPLENGDHLTRAEFERRYSALPALKKAELVEGVVYVGSPVRVLHAQPHSALVGWLLVFGAATPGTMVLDNPTVRLDLDNEYQPDAVLRIDAARGGRSSVSDDGYLEGPPELVVEVAASSASIDRHTKLGVYRRNGVREYLIWQVLDHKLEWFVLRDGEYVALEPDEQGIVQSEQFSGLHLAVAALLRGDFAAVLAAQQAALGTPEHRRFVEALARPR